MRTFRRFLTSIISLVSVVSFISFISWNVAVFCYFRWCLDFLANKFRCFFFISLFKASRLFVTFVDFIEYVAGYINNQAEHFISETLKDWNNRRCWLYTRIKLDEFKLRFSFVWHVCDHDGRMVSFTSSFLYLKHFFVLMLLLQR